MEAACFIPPAAAVICKFVQFIFVRKFSFTLLVFFSALLMLAEL